MKSSRPAALFSLAFALPTLIATLAQCGDSRASATSSAASSSAATSSVASSVHPAIAQDPVATPPADRIHLLISGSLSGRLEPCGCASGQLGGLARRIQHIGERRNYDLLIEGGDLVEHNTELDPLKLMTIRQVLVEMGHYDALGVGGKDLLLPRDQWSGFLAGAPVLASDVTSKAEDWPARPFVQKEVRGIAVRIASLLLELPESLRNEASGLELLPPAAAWARALDGADAATRRIVLVHGDMARIRTLLPQLQPKPDLVVGLDPGEVEPSHAAVPIDGVPIVFAGTRGRVLLDLWLHREGDQGRATCESIPLPGSKTVPGGGGDPQVKDWILEHRRFVQEDGVLARMARQLPTANGSAYVGNSACKTCHPTAFAAWQQSKHAGAWKTLVDAEQDQKRYGWPVTAYPDCVSCHVVGFREQTGFVSFEETPDLAAVGCERCHGAGLDHMQSNGQKKLGLIGGASKSQLCTQCHDYEQSPTFLYGERWPLIQHGREQPK